MPLGSLVTAAVLADVRGPSLAVTRAASFTERQVVGARGYSFPRRFGDFCHEADVQLLSVVRDPDVWLLIGAVMAIEVDFDRRQCTFKRVSARPLESLF